MKNAKFLVAVFCMALFGMLTVSANALQSIELKPGWNQISSPIAEGIDIATIENSCTILQYKNQKLWAWDAQAQVWTYPTKVEPLKGYWVYVAYVCTVPISGTPETYSTLQLYKGWNKVSASGALSAISGTCAGHMVGNWIWNWDKATDSWIHPTEMQLDKGYWIKVDTDCVMGASNPGDTVQSPAFSPAGGTYSSAQTVTISTTTSGATIHYTTDGTTPTESSATYSSPISVSSTKTIKAGAWKTGMMPSSIASATYTIGGGGSTVATPTFSPTSGAYSSAQTVTISTATSGATIHYTLDGTTPTTASTTYTAPISVSSTKTIKAGAWKTGMTPSSIASATYTIGGGTNSLSLKTGWNQISSTVSPGIDVSAIEQACTIIQYKDQKLWAWDAQAQVWLNPTIIEPFKGYWVYVAYVCTVQISGTPAAFSSLQLYKGWNKVSASGSLSDILGTCSGHIIHDWIWNWDKENNKWIHPATMQLDKGYWINVDADCVLGG